MLEESIISFIVNGCYSDTLKYKELIKKKFKRTDENQLKGQWSYITELLIITIKSLIPSKEIEGVVIDYTRFKHELKLWYYYRHGYNDSIINSLKKHATSLYWTLIDDSTYVRVFPIVVSNAKWEIIRDQVILNILFTTGNIENILECIALSKLLHMIMNHISNYEEIIDGLKEEIIKFSQSEFLEKYNDVFRLSLDTFTENYNISFERKRISLLNVLNGISISNDFPIIKKSLNIVNEKDFYIKDDESDYFISGLKGLLGKLQYDKQLKDRQFIESLGSYLLKLRKSRIIPESLEISNYYLPDVFSFKEGELFEHSLLNKCKVLKRENNPNFTRSYIKTKAGIYRFFKYNSI